MGTVTHAELRERAGKIHDWAEWLDQWANDEFSRLMADYDNVIERALSISPLEEIESLVKLAEANVAHLPDEFMKETAEEYPEAKRELDMLLGIKPPPYWEVRVGPRKVEFDTEQQALEYQKKVEELGLTTVQSYGP